MTLDRRATDLVPLVRRVVAEQQAIAAHRIRAKLPRRLTGNWDATRIERVIANLVSNAVKYSPERSTISIRVAREGRNPATAQAVIAVRDEGVGIPADDLPRVVEMFHRGANAAALAPGSGVGLAGAKQIVDQHGGTMTIDSVAGQGTTVTVRLPFAWLDEEAHTATRGPQTSRRAPER